ncbi:MAG: Co2+/Mg2+ efflux protein ApaG [Rhodospirillales bacterium]|nr:Co2+/Mg2+ efflux protein ApaG [Rhodospirillales bacterium]
MYETITRSISVRVEPCYLDEKSAPDEDYFVWAYKVSIQNQGEETVQLRHRHWQITDARGRVQEVSGEGVVGEQPVLAPGEAFEYTSGTPLSAPSGIMLGTYRMETESGDSFDVEIPAFSLDSPYDDKVHN